MPFPRPVIAGNWKMHLSKAEALALSAAVVRELQVSQEQGSMGGSVIVCPSFTLLGTVNELLKESGIGLGAQDCSPEPQGAFTGDVSCGMLKDMGCTYVIVGHSERRTIHHETSELVARKAGAVLNAGLTPIICVGETLDERESGRTLNVLEAQLKHSVPEGATPENTLIAYEPVWAIGTGKVATCDDIRTAHAHILSVLGSSKFTVLYGGSVKADNASQVFATEGVGGVLVGGASLNATDFGIIMRAGGVQKDAA